MPRGCWHFVSLRPTLAGQGEPVGASRELSPLPSDSPSGTNRKPKAGLGGCTDNGAASGSSPGRTDVGKDVPWLAHTPQSLGARSPPLTRARTNSQVCSQLCLGLDWSCQPPLRSKPAPETDPHHLSLPPGPQLGKGVRAWTPGAPLKGNPSRVACLNGTASRYLLTLLPEPHQGPARQSQGPHFASEETKAESEQRTF